MNTDTKPAPIPSWDHAEVFDSNGALALQHDGFDRMYCTNVQHVEVGPLDPVSHQAWVDLIVEAPKLARRVASLEKALLDTTKECEAYSDAIGAPDYSGGPEDAGPDPLHYDLWHLAEERRKSALLLTLVQRYASECSSCDRKGTVEYGPNAGQPCPDCADIRAVLAEVNAPRPHAESRWACPKCKSLNVQVALPAWHRETAGLNLEFVETDAEADVLFWFCEDCEESDSGMPTDTLAPPAIAEQLTPEEIEAIKAAGPHEPLVLNRIGSALTRIIYPDDERQPCAGFVPKQTVKTRLDMLLAAAHDGDLTEDEGIELRDLLRDGQPPGKFVEVRPGLRIEVEADLRPEDKARIDAAFARLNDDLAAIDEQDPPDPQDSCEHDWNHTGTAYGGDDESYRGEGRVICRKCGADGDA
jgi:hypothetical protein